MTTGRDWKVALAVQPRQDDYDYDLTQALGAVVGIKAIVPSDALTAESLGTERAGHGVLIREDGVILTIGYLITEAESIWISFNDGRVVPGHVVAYDQETGFGLVQALARLNIRALPLGQSSEAEIGDRVVIGAAGGRDRSIAARIAAKHEFAGNWEYVLDEAIFTAPAHPNWGGTAAIGPAGDLIGIGSLQIQQGNEQSPNLNMIVPIDLLKPIFDDLLTIGRRNRPPRPWLGLFAAEIEDKIVVTGMSSRGPAQRTRLRLGDVVLAVGGMEVKDLAGFFRQIWSLGDAGVEVPLLVHRDGHNFQMNVPSTDRSRLFKAPVLH